MLDCHWRIIMVMLILLIKKWFYLDKIHKTNHLAPDRQTQARHFNGGRSSLDTDKATLQRRGSIVPRPFSTSSLFPLTHLVDQPRRSLGSSDFEPVGLRISTR